MSKAAPLSPLKAREYQQQAQRCVRLAVNTLNRGRDKWAEASLQGRSLLTDLSNLLLEEQGLSNCNLGALSTFPGLLDAAAGKLQRQQADRLKAVVNCAGVLREAAATVASAAADVADFICGRPEDEKMADEYNKEMVVKEAIVADLSSRLGDADEIPESQKKFQGDEGPATTHPLLREALQVCIAAWMLEPELNSRSVEESLYIISEEMRGF